MQSLRRLFGRHIRHAYDRMPPRGMLQSVPDPLLISLHDRANRFRLAGDFTEAARVYAQALAAEPNDADAHWARC